LSFLYIRAVAAVLGRSLFALDLAQRPRQREQAQRLVERHGLQGHRLEEGRGAWLLVRALGRQLRDVRPVAAFARDNRATSPRIDTQLLVTARLREQLLGHL